MLNNAFESLDATAKFIARELCREIGYNKASISYNTIDCLYSFEFNKENNEKLYLNILLVENGINIMLYYVNKVIEEFCLQSVPEKELDNFNLCKYNNIYFSMTEDIYVKDLSRYLSNKNCLDNIIIRLYDVEGEKLLSEIEPIEQTPLHNEIINQIAMSYMLINRYYLKKISIMETETETNGKIIIGNEKKHETIYIKIKKENNDVYCLTPIKGEWKQKKVCSMADIFDQMKLAS